MLIYYALVTKLVHLNPYESCVFILKKLLDLYIYGIKEAWDFKTYKTFTTPNFLCFHRTHRHTTRPLHLHGAPKRPLWGLAHTHCWAWRAGQRLENVVKAKQNEFN